MKAVITVIGKDKVGIIAGVSQTLAKNNTNILDISQTIMQDIFTMIMLVEISKIPIHFNEFSEALNKQGQELGVSIKIQHEDVFNSMHRI